jgi:osmotically-inducible protein OsmY
MSGRQEKSAMKVVQCGIWLAVMVFVLTVVPVLPHLPVALASSTGQESAAPGEAEIQSDLVFAFNKKRFRNVRVSVTNGVIDLNGSVDLFADKEDANKKALHEKKIVAVRNGIKIVGAKMSDKDLETKLVEKLKYDRVGYGTTTFNAITVKVRDGVVTLGGNAYSSGDKLSALPAASYIPGVQDVIDDIEVDPLSPEDDGIRLYVAHAVYGDPSLNKYAIDPGSPIRISIRNGTVVLSGAVETDADKNLAGLRAVSVPGVSKVFNNIQVESDGSGQK